MDIYIYGPWPQPTGATCSFNLGTNNRKLSLISLWATNGDRAQRVPVRTSRAFCALRVAAHVTSPAAPGIRAPDHDRWKLHSFFVDGGNIVHCAHLCSLTLTPHYSFRLKIDAYLDFQGVELFKASPNLYKNIIRFTFIIKLFRDTNVILFFIFF